MTVNTVTVQDEEQKPWTVDLPAFTPVQWMLIEQYARRIIEGSRFGTIIIEIADAEPKEIQCVERIRL